MLKKDKEGFYFQTEKGKYSLLEGMTIGGEDSCSSDILFIVDDTDITKPVKIVGFLYGAFQLTGSRWADDNSDYIDSISRIIEVYENGEQHE